MPHKPKEPSSSSKSGTEVAVTAGIEAGCQALLRAGFQDAAALLELLYFELCAHIPPHRVGADKLAAQLLSRRKRITEHVKAKRIYVKVHGIRAEAEKPFADLVHIEEEMQKIAKGLLAASKRSEKDADAAIHDARKQITALIATAREQISGTEAALASFTSRRRARSVRLPAEEYTVVVVNVAPAKSLAHGVLHPEVDRLLQRPLTEKALRATSVQMASTGDGIMVLFKKLADAIRYVSKWRKMEKTGVLDKKGTRIDFRIGIATGEVRIQPSKGMSGKLSRVVFDPRSPAALEAQRLATRSASRQMLLSDATFARLNTKDRAAFPVRIKKPSARGSRPKANAGVGQPRTAAALRRRAASIKGAESLIRILHLSDLHFDKDSDVEEQLHALHQDLQKKMQPPDRIDLLVVSGDFRNKGCPHGFGKALEFLTGLRNALGIRLDQCVFVPGNHDVSVDGDFYHVRRSRPDTVDLRAAEKDDVWIMIDPKNGAQRFAEYQAFAKSLGCEYPLDHEHQSEVRLFPDFGIQFVALNSCWMIGLQNLKASGVSLKAVIHATKEAQNQEAEGRKEGRLSDQRPLLRIGVWHHAVQGPESMGDVSFVNRLLDDLDLDLVLHGDVHEIRHDFHHQWRSGKTLHVVGCGTLGATTSARPESTPQCYNIIEIDREHCYAKVQVRKRNSTKESWTAFCDFPNPNGSSDDAKLPWYRIEPLKRHRPKRAG